MNAAQHREAFFASVLLAWTAGGERVLRITHLTQDADCWLISATEGPWCLQVEGDTFVDTAKLLFKHAANRGFDDDLLDGAGPD